MHLGLKSEVDMAEEENDSLREEIPEESVIPEDIQNLASILESVKQKADLLERVTGAVDLGREAHDKANSLSVDDALGILEVLGVIANQQRPNLEPFVPDSLQEAAVEIMLEVSLAHKRILSHINK
jgi:hypothetical protein